MLENITDRRSCAFDGLLTLVIKCLLTGYVLEIRRNVVIDLRCLWRSSTLNPPEVVFVCGAMQWIFCVECTNIDFVSWHTFPVNSLSLFGLRQIAVCVKRVLYLKSLLVMLLLLGYIRVTLSLEVLFKPSAEELAENKVLWDSKSRRLEHILTVVNLQGFRPGYQRVLCDNTAQLCQ